MVSNVSFTSSAIRYLNDEPVVNKKDTIIDDAKSAVSSVPLSLAFIEGPRVFGTRKNFLRFSEASKAKGATSPGIIKGYGDLFEKIGKVRPKPAEIKAGDLFKRSTWTDGLKNFERLDKVANPGHYEAALKTTSKTGFIANIKNAFSKNIGKPIAETVSKTAVGKKAVDMLKKGNAGIMAVFSGVIELATEVIPAFAQGGIGEGIKQIGKSAAKVATGTLGWVAGEMGGRAAGSVIGGLIGSIFPGAGTAIGTWVGGMIGGIVGGMFASNVAGKVTDKFVGKPFSEIQAEKEKQEQAIAVSQDANSTNELKQATLQKLAQKQQSGKLDENDVAMIQLLQGANPFGSLTRG